MTTLEIYTKGARVWIPHPEKVWEGAKVAENFSKSTLNVTTDEGQAKVLQILSDDDLPPLRNPDILIGENDLTSLSYLHEPAVLYNLQVRFCRQNAIYTYCGIVLVAINPYTEISIYGPDTIWTYRGQAMGDLDPHIFAVAEEAYTKVEREQSDQSIIVSGESGAGKTVSAKYAMRYFATVGGSATETHVERKVLASSPIMEAIGNAKTTRNDNSSRFGKYIELQFSKSYNIVGASMRTYLLEKSRVVFQAPGERNYHVFYQLCAVRDTLPHLMLESASTYGYLMSEDSSIDTVDDKSCYEETVSAFHTLGLSSNDVDDIFLILAGILNLGNISIFDSGQGDSDSCDISPQDKSLNILCHLLSLEKGQLRQVLCHRKIVSTRESITKRMSTMEAQGARDALAKHIYACLFSWIVLMVNRVLRSSADSKHLFIGVLDIYGFETFDVNSFEQFCINYANEKLQQQFNMHVFKLEQEEYLKEDIEWKFIDFYDNQPCIDLIECKLGILNLLDEECRMPKGSDSSWAEKLYSKCSQWDHFAKPRFGASSFILKHFADKVTYEVIGFLEKNRDTVLEEQVEVLRNSGNQLLRKLFREDSGDDSKLSVPKPKVRLSVQAKPSPSLSSSKNKKTVGSQFRDSLNALMATLNSTTPHYIRCIKPNDNKAAFQYNPSRAVQQLRACGVLETIRISAAGFPSRWLYSDFLKRYRALCRSCQVDRNNIEFTCQKLLENVIKDTDKYKFGRTKIFFRAGQVAYLERLRSEKLLACCIMIQKTIRGFLGKLHYARTRAAIVTIQRYARGYLARRKVENIKMNKAATVIQRFSRGWIQRRKYQKLRKTVLGLQTRSRGYLARKKFNEMRRNKAAIMIQKTVRGWLCRVKYLKTLRKIILVQSIIRRFLARKRFVKIRREARSAEGRLKKLQKLNIGLENKIISLQQKIGEISKENTYLKNTCQELAEMRVKLDALRGIEGQLKEANKNIFQRDSEISVLKEQIDELVTTVKGKEKLDKEMIAREVALKQENQALKSQMEKIMNEVNSVKKIQEDEFEERVEQEKKLLQGEHNQERIAHQKLLAEKNALEARVEALERELQSTLGHHSHRRSLSNASTVSVHEEDVGYASVKSVASSGRDETMTPEQVSPSADIALVLKLQQKLRLLESENHRLHSRVEAGQPNPSAISQDSFMVQELEMEISKLRSDLLSLRECVASDAMNSGSSALQEITRQLEARENEITRLKDENVHLRNVFSGKAQSAKSLALSSYSSCKDVDTSLINEDGELILAFEAQKKTLRQLEEELQEKTMRWEVEREELVAELVRLRGEYEKHQVILLGGLTPGSQSQTESFLQNEVKRLSSEYLELQDKYDLKSAKCRRLQKHINELTKRLKDAGIDDIETKAEILEKVSTQVLPVVRKKEREYMGMFKIEAEDVNVMLKHLLDLKPKVAKTLLPCLPSYILFMCVRHTDYNNDERMLQSLILGYTKSVTKTLRKRTNDIDFGILWLANTLRLINNLKQYSGEKHFAKDNSKMQNKQCLQNFDLSEFRQVLSDSAIFLYQTVVRNMEDKLQPLAVPAILEHEAISGLTSSTRTRSSSTVANQPVVKKALDELLAQLTWFHRALALNGIDVGLVVQCFRQLFYFLCASSLNNLLLRKEYCHWSKGMQIRYNLSHLEQWAREIKFQDPKITEMLAPIIQASQLLQARKTDADVDSVAEMCSKLTSNQIVKLLNLYTPADSFEEAVSESFIKKMQQRLLEIRSIPDSTLMMDVKHTFPLEIPFTPSSIRLEDIEIPEVLNLPMLKKI